MASRNRAPMARQVLLLHNILFDLLGCYLTHLTRNAKIPALHQRAQVPFGMERAERLRHRHPPCTPQSPPCSWLSPAAFWHQILKVS